MRILFTGGGSGGHIFPIIAVKREIDNLVPEEIKSSLFQFLGGKTQETEVLLKENISFKKIVTVKWRRYFSFKNILDIFKFPISFLQALFKVWLIMPDLIFSKGGPGSFPVMLVGWLYQIPIVIHESDSVPGSTSKLSSPIARKIAISFKESEDFFPKKHKRKLVLTGNPIRQKLFYGSKEKAIKNFNLNGKRKIILIMGGSQGSEQINSLFLDALLKYIEKYEIIHICGPNNFKNIDLFTRGALDDAQKVFYHLYPFLDEEQLADAYQASDLVISRAGAGAIFELAALEKPSILIPLQGGAQDHQSKNAQCFQKYGATISVEGCNVTPNFVFGRASQILENKKTLQEMKNGCKNFAMPDAAKKVATVILEEI